MSRAERAAVLAIGAHEAVDLTHIHFGEDGWGPLAAIIACCDRGIVSRELSPRGRALEADRALEEASLHRFSTLARKAQSPVVRCDNGLISATRRFRAALRDYRLSQVFTTRYTLEQNGMIGRFFRSLKEERVW